MNPVKAVALISGGLDSTLAARLIKEQGINIVALNFKTPFCLCDKRASGGCKSQSRKVAEDLNLELKIINLTDDFFKILKNPAHGYGSHMNPCIDCRILMLRKAKEFMQETGAKFVITGEVLGQRPMSQYRRALELIDRESGLEGLILRPLTAKLLPETLAEKENWVNRERLLNFSGRTRKPQIQLAKDFKIKDYPCSSGGCLLTDAGFSNRLKDLLKTGELNLNNVELLKLGRHFRIAQEAKLVVGRDEKENGQLVNLARENDYLFFPNHELAGPTALGRGNFNSDLLKLSCSITCRYCDINGSKSASIVYKLFSGKEDRIVNVSPLEEKELASLRI